MHAIEVAETGGPEVLRYVEKPRPSPGAGEVLIKAEAIGVNCASLSRRPASTDPIRITCSSMSGDTMVERLGPVTGSAVVVGDIVGRAAL